MARFERGHKLAKGGKRTGAGRLTNQKAAAKKLVAEMVRDYVEKHVRPVLETYRKNAVGHYEKRWTEGKDPKEYEVWVVDAATTRHWIDKFLPAAKQEIALSGGLKIIRVNAFDPDR
jgi:hypothetical protein